MSQVTPADVTSPPLPPEWQIIASLVSTLTTMLSLQSQSLQNQQQILHNQQAILQRINQMALDFTALQAAVAAETTVDASVQSLLTQLADEITAANGDPATLAGIVTTMQTNAAALGAAVTANTPAAPSNGGTSTVSGAGAGPQTGS